MREGAQNPQAGVPRTVHVCTKRTPPGVSACRPRLQLPRKSGGKSRICHATTIHQHSFLAMSGRIHIWLPLGIPLPDRALSGVGALLSAVEAGEMLGASDLASRCGVSGGRGLRVSERIGNAGL